jgi:hypothetical protein
MKKLLLFTLLAIIGALFLSSCATSVMKRHYRNGFFVAHKKHPVIPRIANTTIQAAERSVIEKETTKEINAATLESTLSVKEAEPSPKKPEAKAEEKTGNKKHRLSVEHRKFTELVSLPKMKQSVHAVGQKIVNPEAGLVGAALSLFWIVILVVLLIYLAGLLFDNFGLGSLIHILAVVVVVLLILWLLRVI